MKVFIQQAAVADLRRGYRFYERQESGLGAHFLDSLTADIDSLQLYAGSHSVHFGKFYRMLSKRFPFAVFYQIENDLVRVQAVLDLRHDPNWIVGKIQKR